MRDFIQKNLSTYQSDFGANVKVEIGGSGALFLPEARIDVWGEAHTIIRYETSRRIAPILISDKLLTWESQADGLRIEYRSLAPTDQFEDGALDIALFLLKRPQENVFRFSVDTHNLEWCYQPPLTAEQIRNGAFRPENVIGSYAVYHATRDNFHTSVVDAEKFRSGKAFHVFRPLVWDAGGKQIFADLMVDAGVMTIAVDKGWLDAALYPVIIDPTFGYGTLGASGYTFSAYEICCSQIEALAPAGTLTNMTLGLTPAASNRDYRFVLYSDSSNAPYNRLAYDAATWQPGSTAKAWYTDPVALSYTMTLNAQYWILAGGGGGDGYEFSVGILHYDSSGSRRLGRADPGSTWPDPMTNYTEREENMHTSCYGTYTAGGETKSLADVGAGSDSIIAPRVSLTKTDIGSGSDSIVPARVSFTKTDSGIGADSTPIGAVLPNQTDSGSGTDALGALLASLGISDGGTGSDVLTAILATLGITDSGAGIDTIAGALANLALTDSATAADVIQAFFLVSLLDSGLGNDLIGAITASVGIPDTGIGADIISALNANFGLPDTASGADLISAVMSQLGIQDAGTAVDVISAFFLAALADAGVGTDSIASLMNLFGLSDQGEGADLVSVLGGSIVTLYDSGSGVDVVGAVLASLGITDAATGVDSAQGMILIATTDSGTGVDQIYQVAVSASIQDTGAGAEAKVVTVTLGVTDLGTGLETPTVIASISLSDSGAGIDLLDVVKQAIIALLDSGIGADSISGIQVIVPIAETATGLDLVSMLSAALSIADLGTGVDVAINLTLLGTYNKLTVSFRGKSGGVTIVGKKGCLTITGKKFSTEFS